MFIDANVNKLWYHDYKMKQHYRKLKEIQKKSGRVDNKAPEKLNLPKRISANTEREARIKRENDELLRRLLQISKKKAKKFSTESASPQKSLISTK